MASVETAEDLYGLPLERFIPERTALAKALRAEKRRDEAAEVAAKRKPSVAAWAVNQLVRTQGKSVAALSAAGDDLADAQAAAAEGKKTAEQMRGAMRRQRDAIESLVEAARGLLSQDGHPLSAQTLERVGDTLRAASIDPDAREQVQTGCLTAELRVAGLGLGELGGALAASLSPAPSAPSAAPARPRKAAKAKPSGTAGGSEKAAGRRERKRAEAEAERAEAERAERAEAERAERERKEQLRVARRAEREARRAATRAEKEHQAAQQQRDEAEAALREAETRLEQAATTHERASAELTEAEAEVARLEDLPAPARAAGRRPRKR